VFNLRVIVEDVRGFCDLPLVPGDYFEVCGGRITIPEGSLCVCGQWQACCLCCLQNNEKFWKKTIGCQMFNIYAAPILTGRLFFG
jgi:hypothetical protein